MPFSLSKSLATFQHFINDIFRNILDQCVVIYLDHSLNFSETQLPPDEHIHIVLECLHEHWLYAKLEKYEFGQSSMQFLDYIVSSSDISMDSRKVSMITYWAAPRNVCERQHFLGFANFYQHFIKDFVGLVSSMTALLLKNT